MLKIMLSSDTNDNLFFVHLIHKWIQLLVKDYAVTEAWCRIVKKTASFEALLSPVTDGFK